MYNNNFRRNNEGVQDLPLHHRASSPDSIDSNLSELNIDEEQSTSGLLGSPSTDSDDNNASNVNSRFGTNNNNNQSGDKNAQTKSPFGRQPFLTPNLLPPLPPQFQFGNMMAGQSVLNSQSNKNPGIGGLGGLEAMHMFMQSPLFQHFQKQFLMQQQLFAQQQQFLMQQQQQQKQPSQKSAAPVNDVAVSTKTSTSPAQKKSKLSIEEILKQRVKPTNVAAVEADDHPTDTSGSNGIGEEDEMEEGKEIRAESMEASQTVDKCPES